MTRTRQMPVRRLAVVVGLAALTPLLGATAASATTPTPTNDPAVWGPALAPLCDSPDAARRAGYIVIIGTTGNDRIVGTRERDAIFGRGGNDNISGGEGNDLLCLGDGFDRGRGDGGSDAVFGGDQRDYLQGNDGRDYLDGGSQKDVCLGGPALDAGKDCEASISIP